MLPSYATGIMVLQSEMELAKHKKIDAIKMLRQRLDLGLKEAKDAIEHAVCTGECVPDAEWETHKLHLETQKAVEMASLRDEEWEDYFRSIVIATAASLPYPVKRAEDLADEMMRVLKKTRAARGDLR